MRVGLVLGLLAGCGATPATPHAPADPSPAYTTAPYVPTGASSADPAESAAVEALLAKLLPALDRCAAPVPAADAPPADPAAAAAAIAAACAEAAAFHDATVTTLGARSRATDTLLAHLARLADDADYLRRALTDAAPEQLSAIKHVRDAIAATRAGAASWSTQIHDTYVGSAAATARPEEWTRSIDNDLGAAHELRPMLDHLCFNQSVNDPQRIRARMLLAVSRPAAAEREARVRALPSMALTPEERAQREALLTAQQTLFRTYDDLVDRFRAGQITTPELKHEQERRIDDAIAAFDAEAARWRSAQPR